MSVESKRDQVLEELYDRLLLDGEIDAFFNSKVSVSPDGKKVAKQQHPVVQLISTLESARVAEIEARQKEDSSKKEAALKEQELSLKKEELKLKDDIALTDNANRDMDRRHQMHIELLRDAITGAVTLVTTGIWSMIFIHELKQTRLFEIDGTEVSAAGRWLKNSFPKPKL